MAFVFVFALERCWGGGGGCRRWCLTTALHSGLLLYRPLGCRGWWFLTVQHCALSSCIRKAKTNAGGC